MESARGQLLVAGPTLLDPNFWRTVVLVIEHTDEGALGLVLNRPSETLVSDAVTELEGLIDGGELLYIGGPVQPAAVVVLARFEDPVAALDLGIELARTPTCVTHERPSLDHRCALHRFV